MAPRGRKKAEGDPSAAEASLDTFGQMTLPIGGEEYRLRPSFEAINAIEEELGRSLYDLSQGAARGALSVREMGVIAAEMMKAQGKTLGAKDPAALDYQGAKPDRVARLIYEAGAPKICARLMVVLVGALNGNYTAEGEAKAGEETKG